MEIDVDSLIARKNFVLLNDLPCRGIRIEFGSLFTLLALIMEDLLLLILDLVFQRIDDLLVPLVPLVPLVLLVPLVPLVLDTPRIVILLIAILQIATLQIVIPQSVTPWILIHPIDLSTMTTTTTTMDPPLPIQYNPLLLLPFWNPPPRCLLLHLMMSPSSLPPRNLLHLFSMMFQNSIVNHLLL